MNKLLLFTYSLFFISVAHAQDPGDLDADFGIGGYAMYDPYANTGEFYWDIITLADDKIVNVGFTSDDDGTDILIAKFLADGTPDTDFGTDGFVKMDLSLGGDEDARGIVELPNGKFLITGYIETVGALDGYVARLNADGTLDDSFGTSNGYTKFNTGDELIAYGRSVISDGNEIFVGGAALIDGQSDLIIVNLTQGGGIDASFASSGFASMDIAGGDDHMQAMDLKSNGSFVFGGSADSSDVLLGYVGSLSQFGTPTTFGVNGSYTFDMGSGLNEVYDLYVDADDKVVLTGDEGVYPNVNGFISRLTSGGMLDATFATDGTITSDPGATTALYLRGLVETPNGEIVAVGNFDGASQDMYAMMVTSDGSLVSDFGGNGDVIHPFAINTSSVSTAAGAVQTDGSIILGGYLTSEDFIGENMFTVRLLPNGDTSIEDVSLEDLHVYPNPAKDQFNIQLNHVDNVELISLQGAVVQSWGLQTLYDLPQGIADGVYILKVYAGDSIYTTRLMIK